MPTLDLEEYLPEQYKAIFRYHSTRPPSDDMVFQLAASLQLARRMSRAAATKVIAVLNGDVTPARAELVRQVMRYHLRADVNSSARVHKRITSVLNGTAKGLSEPVQLSDVLSHYIWNLYEVYHDGLNWDDARIELEGDYREDNPARSRGGYVEVKEGDEVFLNLTRTVTRVGSIHIEFSYAAVYPRRFLAHCIVHEATHKFAGTDDYAYTDEDKYAGLTGERRLNNADSYAYTILSLYRNRLVTDLEMALRAIRRNDRTDPPTFTRRPADDVL
jgi:hypothetical protein